jgi:hypothetical protein
MLLRLAYLGITNEFALLPLLPASDGDKDAEILALRHQLTMMHRQLGGPRIRFEPADRAFLGAILSLPRPALPNPRSSPPGSRSYLVRADNVELGTVPSRPLLSLQEGSGSGAFSNVGVELD